LGRIPLDFKIGLSVKEVAGLELALPLGDGEDDWDEEM